MISQNPRKVRPKYTFQRFCPAFAPTLRSWTKLGGRASAKEGCAAALRYFARCASSVVLVLLVAAMLCWDTSPAFAQGPAAPPQKPLSAERLAMPLFPSGWEQVSTNRGNIEVIDYVPKGETVTAWRNKITLEVYHELNTLPLDAIQRRAQGQNRDACEGSVEGRFQSGVNNGYPSAFWILGCKRNRDTGMGETRYTKAIQGGQRVYIITRAWRTPAFGDQGPDIAQRDLEDAVAFLTTTVACTDGDAKHPCPTAK